MDPVHEMESMDPVNILMDPRRGSMDQGSIFWTFPCLIVVNLTMEPPEVTHSVMPGHSLISTESLMFIPEDRYICVLLSSL